LRIYKNTGHGVPEDCNVEKGYVHEQKCYYPSQLLFAIYWG